VPFRPALADGRVMHVGQPVALVIADSFPIAQEAADHIEVAYDQLPPVVAFIRPSTHRRQDSGRGAIQPGLDWPGVVDDRENEAEVKRIIATAAHVAKVSAINQRLVVASMEPAAHPPLSTPSTASIRFVAGRRARPRCARVAATLGVAVEKVVVITEDVAVRSDENAALSRIHRAACGNEDAPATGALDVVALRGVLE